MTKGFGQAKEPKKPATSDREKKREVAGRQLDAMKAQGLPEYEIYMRVKDKKPWFPVGTIAVKRSSQVNQAIFANEKELCQGAFRLFPILKKNQQAVEYGHRLKEYKDEEIQLAVRPEGGVAGGLKNALAVIIEIITGPFKKKPQKPS
jgi:Family of unknown function (DUF6523)